MSGCATLPPAENRIPITKKVYTIDYNTLFMECIDLLENPTPEDKMMSYTLTKIDKKAGLIEGESTFSEKAGLFAATLLGNAKFSCTILLTEINEGKYEVRFNTQNYAIDTLGS